MVTYNYLNRLLIDKLPARSGSFKLSPECLGEKSRSSEHSTNTITIANYHHQVQSTQQSDEKKLEEKEEEDGRLPVALRAQVMANEKENFKPIACGKSQAKLMIKSMTLRRRERLQLELPVAFVCVRENKFAILNTELSSSPPAQSSLRNTTTSATRAKMTTTTTKTTITTTTTNNNATTKSKSSNVNASAATLSFMLALLFLLACLLPQVSQTEAMDLQLARENSRSPTAATPNFGFPSAIDWRRIGSNFFRQFVPTWGGSSGSSSGSSSDDSSSSTRFPFRRQPPAGPFRRAMNRLRQQMGARNEIRVHNAFRDFAWRVLSSLSMPTPVIYELRRQNFYPAEEDALNDNFYNRNTSRTIRSKRLLDAWWPPTASASTSFSKRASKSDDDDEPETFRERLRSRFDELINLSRRSLFGRVVRLPSLLPFKRQEEEDGDDRTDAPTGKAKQSATSSSSSSSSSSSTSRRPLLPLGSRWRRRSRNEFDRQIIEINGKQFYVDDDGELKELKEPRQLT